MDKIKSIPIGSRNANVTEATDVKISHKNHIICGAKGQGNGDVLPHFQT